MHPSIIQAVSWNLWAQVDVIYIFLRFMYFKIARAGVIWLRCTSFTFQNDGDSLVCAGCALGANYIQLGQST